MKEHLINVDKDRCIGCGQCQRDCPESNILVKDKKARILSQNCIKCGHCVAVCPKAAVFMTGFKELPEEMKSPVVLDPEQLLAALKTRRTIRQFQDQNVPMDVLRQIIEAGRWTHSGENAQNVSYVILKDQMEPYEALAVGMFRKLFPLAKLLNPVVKHVTIDDHFFFKKAPAVILVVSRDKINGALAASNMELMAQAHGLGVLYSGFFAMAVNHSAALRRKLGLKRGERLVTALVLGYPAVKYHRTAQREAAGVAVK